MLWYRQPHLARGVSLYIHAHTRSSCGSIYSLSLCDCSLSSCLQVFLGDLHVWMQCVFQCVSHILYMYMWDIIYNYIIGILVQTCWAERRLFSKCNCWKNGLLGRAEQNKAAYNFRWRSHALSTPMECRTGEIHKEWRKAQRLHITFSSVISALSAVSLAIAVTLFNLHISLPPLFMPFLVAMLLVLCMFYFTSPFSLLPSIALH